MSGARGTPIDRPGLDVLFGARGRARAFTAPFNTTGQPAIAVPAALTESGTPTGVQLAAAYGREDLLVCVAARLEAERPWASHRPPVFPAGAMPA
ncbi:amidase family protein [Streptomyces sp. DASNCL29]|uniref:amidase family protein n=1 Tax=Streptomyces sp. DASNCL29 TaxID=2583819 RepID=UPI001F0DE90C|nr:amidase family protein [Streptomyces sp. DASNCL29]